MTTRKGAAGLVATDKKKALARRPRRSTNVGPEHVDAAQGFEPGSAPDILCRVALDLFSSRNFSTVTIKDISDATGFNASLIYYYFGNKEGLFMKAIDMTVEEAFRSFDAISANAKTPDELISLWMELHVRQFTSLQKLAKISLDYANTDNRIPATDRSIKSLYDKEAKLLGFAIQRGIVEGMFRPVNPAETATIISTFLDGVLFRNAMFPNSNYAQSIRSMRKIILSYLMGGMPHPTDT